MRLGSVFIFALGLISGCNETPEIDPGFTGEFHFGADLSYVNQILDHGGVYKSNLGITDPYKLFSEGGMDIIRLRLWHNPVWTKEVYEPDGNQVYNDLLDVERAIKAAKDQGMSVFLDFHYSNEWADPGSQKIPAAWADITNVDDLVDSVYNYTFKTLTYLNNKGLMPEYLQIGNETNCGMLYTDALANFPACEVCDNGNWTRLGLIMNAAIDAVRDVSASTKISLHIADPQHAEWWFDNITTNAAVTDFDIIGFSYYPLWHTTVAVNDLSGMVAYIRTRYNKDVMMLETAYPWTLDVDDAYTNIFGSGPFITGFPFTRTGQLAMMATLAQEMIDGGGTGMIYWEPAWITSDLKTMWGTGSAWENCTLFDYDAVAANMSVFTQHKYK